MGYERGYIPPFHDQDRPRALPFSWKAVVLTLIVLTLMAAPFIAIWITGGSR